MKYNLSRLRGKIIAIDGPAGTGKSTTATLVAARLGYTYLDTGAMYRALTYYALKHDVSPSDSVALGKLAAKLPITFKNKGDINRVFIAGHEVTEEIRTPEVTREVSEVSAHKGVRDAMVRQQMEMGKEGSIVAEGRDTTTVVFTHADLKIYLDASVEERARRRLIDLTRMGVATNLEELKKEIQRRDDFDSGRKHSPLTRAPGVIVLDTTELTIEDQVSQIVSLAMDRFR
ncbi:MAG: (d)CMP kinase [Candidatus Zixiibacteriota bacterium]|nr:MAG: (d)CMP kinase [candidate division Zixibacteria bacterium]